MTIWVTFSKLGEAQNLGRQSLPTSSLGLGAQALGQLERFVDALPLLRRIERLPGRSTVTTIHGASIRSARRLAVRTISRRDRRRARRRRGCARRPPRALDRLRLHALDQIGIDAFGGAAQRQFAQRGQVLRLEEVVHRARGGVLDVDLAFGQPLEQFVGRQIDQHDLVGVFEHRVGHRLAHPHARDLLDDVVEAFEVLDVERGPDIDAGGEQFLDILLALGMAAARDVGVGKFVDQQQARPARKRRVEVELRQQRGSDRRSTCAADFEPIDQRLGLRAAVRLDQADHDIAALGLLRAGGDQHRVGLADAGRGAEKNLQLPAAFLLGESQQGVRRGALSVGGHGIRRCLRLQRVQREVEFSTLTRGSPKNAEPAAFDLACAPGPHLLLRQAARLGDPRDLKLGVCRGRCAGRARCRGRDRIGRNGPSTPSACSGSTSAFTRSISFCEVGPRFEPPELAAL